jgi:hypothetical protein
VTKTLSRTATTVVEQSTVLAKFRLGRRGVQVIEIPIETEMTRRDRIIASIPSAADLDLIAINPPPEWLADNGWQ